MNKAVKAIHYLMANTPAITAEIPANKVFPVRAPQSTQYPYVAHQLLSNRPEPQKDSASNFDFAQIQLSIYAETMTEAQDIAEAIRTGLDKQRGTFDGVAVANIEYLGESHLPEDGAGNDQIYLIQIEFEVNYHR
jgi:hypothetical protein